MLKIASIHFGSGSGHVIAGVLLWQYLKLQYKKDFLFSLITDTPIEIPIQDESLEILTVHPEPGKMLLRDRETMLYHYLKHIDPDVLIIDSIWFPVCTVLGDFKAIKIYFTCFMPSEWYITPPLDNERVFAFQPKNYDLAFTIDPHFELEGCINIPPVINVPESLIKPPETIRSVLDVPEDKKLALVAHNGHEGEIEEIIKQADIDPDDYVLRSISSFDEVSKKLFPLSHYMSGVDLAIGGCGYHFFYETKYYNIPTIYIPQPRIGNEQHWRLEHCRDYEGPYDGADKMVEMILDLF